MTDISQDLQVIVDAANQLAQGAAELQREAAAVHEIEDMVGWQGANHPVLEVLRETYIFATAWFEQTLINDEKVLEYAATHLMKWAAEMAEVEASAIQTATLLTKNLLE